MKQHIKLISLCLCVICALSLAGCGKEKEVSPNATDPLPQLTTIPSETELPEIDQEQNTSFTFDYEPGSMGIYVKADPNMTADPEVLDSITMTLSDKDTELTRYRVSNCQFDLVKSGRQIGGFILLDIPREMLEEKPESWEEFTTIADYIAKQIMPDIYPSGSYICGGGHVDFGYDISPYMIFMIETESKIQYVHKIYIGEKHIYDFWHDTSWMADSGGTIMSTLSAEDIKPELNQVNEWTIHDFSDFPGVPGK